MRVTIDGVRHHKCDWCRRDFSEELAPHLTIELGERSGIARHDTPLPGWRIDVPLRPTQLHFCLPEDDSDNCLSKWAATVLTARPAEYVL